MRSADKDAPTVRLGAVVDPGGVNFAVFSAHAERIDLCLFDPDGQERRIKLARGEGHIWHGFVPGAGAGLRYGYRAHGPWDPGAGHLFNPAKLLIDPYARAVDARMVWHQAQSGMDGSGPCSRDSAPWVAKSIACDDRPPVAAPSHEPTLIYEAHVKGLTRLHPDIPHDLRGTYDALAHPAVIDHLTRLGVSHIELLPIAAFLDDRHVIERGLTNYWGYQPQAPFAVEPRYAGPGGTDGLRRAVARLAEAGIGVILDVVFNHTGEGDASGPTLSLRGLDNKSYYALAPGGGFLNHAGTGNLLDLGHPMTLRLVLDALHHWAGLGIAGFRFDLASALLRAGGGLEPGSDFLTAVRQDAVLAKLILIAEPWDIGPGGYRLGHYPAPFREWNDRFRDDVRRFWRGDGRPADLARRLAGSAELFDHGGRAANASVNFLASHDGFTLQDLVSYREKRNEANGEGNRDGHPDEYSDDLGAEGQTDDAVRAAGRDRRKRAMLATLFLAQGTPMLLAGDELGQTQQGNNNAYAQDNELTWLDWSGAGADLLGFVARLSAIRQAFPGLRQQVFLHGRPAADGAPDIVWRRPDGCEPAPDDWARTDWPLGCEIRVSDSAASHQPVFAIFNAGQACEFQLPPGDWLQIIDSAAPLGDGTARNGRIAVAAQSVQLFNRMPGTEKGE